MLAASAHSATATSTAACLYFTFAGKPRCDGADARLRGRRRATPGRCGTPAPSAVLAGGGSLSHHHGVGLNRSRFVAEALGGGLDVLASSRRRSTRKGILNPGKLGLKSAFGSTGPELADRGTAA